MANPVTINLAFVAGISNGLALNQTLTSAANLSLNGTLSSGSIGIFDVARRIAVTSVGNDTGINWIPVGTDRNGNPQSETFAGGLSVASVSLYDYKTVSSIRGTGATAAGVTAGSNGTASTAWYCKEFGSMGTLGVAIYMATQGTNVGSFETTMDDPNAAQSASLSPYGTSVNPQSNIPPVPWPEDGLTGINQTSRNQVTRPVFAWRWTTTSGTTSTIIQVIESTWADEEAR